MITLALDASTYAGDVAILDGTRVLAEATVAMKGAEHEGLMPAVAACLERAGVSVDRVRRVVCGAGPGSFTSLRIAGAIAKGVASGIGCPLFAVPSMALIVGGAKLSGGRFLVAVDALRGEFYVGLYDVTSQLAIAEVEPARLVAAEMVDGLAEEWSAKLISPSQLPGAIVAAPRASAVARIEELVVSRGPVDIGGWEPSYGRLAEAQVRWETAHGKPLTAG
ncbi:MAG: tRNA (adenosine(37)-N6)-threonylcarbamoyltransferase complex dimerization subunit type 1 TsaB [bacterium]